MNTPDEIFKPKLFSDQHERFEKEYPGFHQMIYDSMDEYAKAYAPVPTNEDYEGAGKILYPLELQQIILDYKAWLESMILHVKKSIRPQINEKIKDLDKYNFAAHVPGKEESVEKALEIWENNIPEPLAELLSDFAMNHTYPVRGVIRNLLSKIISECSPASPSTASNEDKTEIKEGLKFQLRDSSDKTVFIIEKINGDIVTVGWPGEDRTTDYNLKDVKFRFQFKEWIPYKNEPKAVQQAAKEYPGELCGLSEQEWQLEKVVDEIKAKTTLEGIGILRMFARICEEEYSAGASFNKDAVEFVWTDELVKEMIYLKLPIPEHYAGNLQKCLDEFKESKQIKQ